MTDTLWSLPGPSGLAATLGDTIRGGASCALVAPDPLRSSEEWVTEACTAADVFVEMVPAEPGRPPAAVVADQFGTDWEPGPGAVAALARSGVFASRVVGLALPASDPAWAAFAAAFLAALPAIPGPDRPQLLIFCGPADLDAFRAQRLPLSELWWWGTVGRLDTTVAAARALGEAADPVTVSCVTEVCGFDLGFVDVMAQYWDGNLACLLDLAAGHGRPPAAVTEWSTLAGAASSRVPAARFRDDWDRGLVDVWERYDPFIAPGALPEEGRTEALKARLWRGQLRELMPLVDEERARLETWARNGPIAERQLTYPIEIGFLRRLLHYDPALRPRTTYTRRQAATWLRDTRNTLAHRDIVARADIAEGLALLDDDRRDR